MTEERGENPGKEKRGDNLFVKRKSSGRPELGALSTRDDRRKRGKRRLEKAGPQKKQTGKNGGAGW